MGVLKLRLWSDSKDTSHHTRLLLRKGSQVLYEKWYFSLQTHMDPAHSSRLFPLLPILSPPRLPPPHWPKVGLWFDISPYPESLSCPHVFWVSLSVTQTDLWKIPTRIHIPPPNCLCFPPCDLFCSLYWEFLEGGSKCFHLSHPFSLDQVWWQTCSRTSYLVITSKIPKISQTFSCSPDSVKLGR